MDGAPKAGGGGGKAVLPVSPASNDANAGAERAARQAPLPEDAAADAPAAAASGGEEEDDEQVERFYALLDSIRVMRGAYGAGTGADDGGASGERRRAAEPPWRPAFRPEDFEEPSPTSSDDAARRAKRTPHRQGADAKEGGAQVCGSTGRKSI